MHNIHHLCANVPVNNPCGKLESYRYIAIFILSPTVYDAMEAGLPDCHEVPWHNVSTGLT